MPKAVDYQLQRSVIPDDRIDRKIYLLRGQNVMLSTDLAKLYGVEPRVLIQAVQRNRERFPRDFMFQLNRTEFLDLKSQIVISSWGGLRRTTPYAFTEQGVAMLSDEAIRSIFVAIHQIMNSSKQSKRRIGFH